MDRLTNDLTRLRTWVVDNILQILQIGYVFECLVIEGIFLMFSNLICDSSIFFLLISDFILNILKMYSHIYIFRNTVTQFNSHHHRHIKTIMNIINLLELFVFIQIIIIWFSDKITCTINDVPILTYLWNYMIGQLCISLIISIVTCSVKYCCWRYSTPYLTGTLDIQNRISNNGLSPEEIELFDIYKLVITSDNKYELVNGERRVDITGKDLTCTICIDDLHENEHIIYLQCEHYFHKNCSEKWFEITKTCPNCRSNVLNNVSNTLQV